MRALSMALKCMSLNRRATLYVSGRVIFAEDSDTGRSKCSANGSSCVSIVHIVLMRGRKSDMLDDELGSASSNRLLVAIWSAQRK